jgi:hypothetical protein
LAKLQKELKFRLVTGQKRKGYKKALKDSLKLPRHDIILFSDGDAEFEPADFWKLKPFIGEYDIVVGVRQGNRSAARLALSKLNMLFIAAFFGVLIRDINCPFRLMKKSTVNNVLKDVDVLIHPSTEFIIRAKKKGYKVRQVPITHYKTPSEFFSPSKAPKIAWKSFCGLVRLRMSV